MSGIQKLMKYFIYSLYTKTILLKNKMLFVNSRAKVHFLTLQSLMDYTKMQSISLGNNPNQNDSQKYLQLMYWQLNYVYNPYNETFMKCCLTGGRKVKLILLVTFFVV